MLKYILRLCISILLISLMACATIIKEPYTSNNASPIRLQYAHVKNGQIEYVRFGHGSPIIFINSYTADLSYWDIRMLNRLATQHDLIIINNRNVGNSYANDRNYSARDLAEDNYQLIQTLHLKHPAVLGISMGGFIAQQLAVMHPHQISALILINTAIAGYAVYPSVSVEHTIFNLSRNIIIRSFQFIPIVAPEGDRTQFTFAILQYRLIPPGYPYDNFPSDATLAQQRSLILNWANDKNTFKEIAHLQTPTLILNGGADILLPPINSDIFAKNIRHSTLIRWQEGGHVMIFQYPIEIADRINNFLADYSC